MKLIVEKGDLFDLDLEKYALAHCISLDAKMDAGIAKEFVKRYPEMKYYLKRTIEENHLNYPVTLKYDLIVDYEGTEHVVYNLITKEKYWEKPTYETLSKALDDLVWYCKQSNRKYLAMCKIGCGLDRLSWNKVKVIIEEKFKDLDIEIVVRYI